MANLVRPWFHFETTVQMQAKVYFGNGSFVRPGSVRNGGSMKARFSVMQRQFSTVEFSQKWQLLQKQNSRSVRPGLVRKTSFSKTRFSQKKNAQ
jgi:hypothetical protein